MEHLDALIYANMIVFDVIFWWIDCWNELSYNGHRGNLTMGTLSRNLDPKGKNTKIELLLKAAIGHSSYKIRLHILHLNIEW